MVGQVHYRNSRNFANSSFEIFVTGRYDVTFVLCDSLDEAVVGVGALVHAGQALKPWVLDDPERHAVLATKLLQLTHHTVSDVRNALGIEAVHHGLDDVESVLDGEVDEVGVDEDVVRRAQLLVVPEEQCRRCLRYFSDLHILSIWLLSFFGLSLVLF